MPVSDDATIEITAYDWVPESAQGLVKDLRVRWALEEFGQPYKVRYLKAFVPKPGDHMKQQPFGQVPTYRDGDIDLFESAAILLYLGEKDERLLPHDPHGKARATTWVCAAINSVEPPIQIFALIAGFYSNEEWAKLRRDASEEFARSRLKQLSDWLDAREWLEDRFTIGDLMMASVLRIVEPFALFDDFPRLRTYLDRAIARPAFKVALDAQLAGFTGAPPPQAA